MISSILRLFGFLSSFIGTLIFATIFYFTLGETYAYTIAIGLIIISFFLLITRVSFRKRIALKSFARQKGMTRQHARLFSNKVQNKYLSGHISRSFLIGTTLFTYNPVLLIPTTIFCALVILEIMRTRPINLTKVILSSILGTASGVTAIIISKFLL